MELWIRSQNKEALANVKNVSFCKMKKCELKEIPCSIKEFVESADAYCVECNGNFFGEYATRERCLEIIDEIQELLKLGNPENAFYNITNCEMPSYQLDELFKRVRKDKAIVTKDVEFEVFMPSIVTYEMPEK